MESGAGTAADWVAVETRQVRREARADLRLAENLETHQVLAAAMAAGRVNVAQGRAIVGVVGAAASLRAVRRLCRAACGREAHLVELAAEHDAKALRILGRRVFEVIAPDVAEQFEGQALEREEAEALRRTTLTMWEDDEGTCHGRFRLPTLHGQMLTKMILAISSPARAAGAADADGRSGIDPDLPTPVRHGIALTQLLESVQAQGPTQDRWVWCHGRGVDDPGPADGQARRRRGLHPGHRRPHLRDRGPPLACSAGIIPIVLGGRGQVLDVAANAACTPKRCGSRWAYATAAAPPSTAKSHRACATPTTTTPGPKAATPTSRPAPDLPAPSPTHPRPPLPDQTPTRRQDQLPPTGVRSSRWSTRQSNRRAADAMAAPKAVRRASRDTC